MEPAAGEGVPLSLPPSCPPPPALLPEALGVGVVMWASEGEADPLAPLKNGEPLGEAVGAKALGVAAVREGVA